RIWSVLRLGSISGQALALSWPNFSMPFLLCLAAGEQGADVCEAPSDRSRGDHSGGHRVGSCTGALSAAEIPVGGRCTSLARRYDVSVDSNTHRAAGIRPFQPGVAEDPVKAFLFGLALYRRGARRHEAGHFAHAAGEDRG